MLLAFALTGMAAPAETLSTTNQIPMRVVFSSSLLRDVPANDARAAVKAWTFTLGKEGNIPADPDSESVLAPEELAAQLRAGTMHAGVFNSEDIAVRRVELPPGYFFAGASGGTCVEEFVLLVRQDAGVKSVDDLRGRSLTSWTAPRTYLADLWLEVLLQERNLGRPAAFFSHTETRPKPSQVVLPVFFGKQDACLVTRKAFRAMAELNPQIDKALIEVSHSEEIVPSIFFVRRDLTESYLKRVLEALRTLHLKPAGRQVLQTFQLDQVIDCTPEQLAKAHELVARHARLCGPAKVEKALPNTPAALTAQAAKP